MPTLFLPKVPRDDDYYIASLVYIASGPNKDDIIKFEDEDNPSNVRSDEVKNFIEETLPAEDADIVRMHMRYNVFESLISRSDTSEIDKIKAIADSLMKRLSLKNVAYASNIS